MAAFGATPLIAAPNPGASVARGRAPRTADARGLGMQPSTVSFAGAGAGVRGRGGAGPGAAGGPRPRRAMASLWPPEPPRPRKPTGRAPAMV